MTDKKASKTKGPASYFPSIEEKYGKPIDHWIGLVEKRDDETHMQRVKFLKDEHEMGHGHANAIVAHVMAKQSRK